MGGGRKRACLLLLPGVPQWGHNFYFLKQKYIFEMCANDLKTYIALSHQAFVTDCISTFFAVI